MLWVLFGPISQTGRSEVVFVQLTKKKDAFIHRLLSSSNSEYMERGFLPDHLNSNYLILCFFFIHTWLWTAKHEDIHSFSWLGIWTLTHHLSITPKQVFFTLGRLLGEIITFSFELLTPFHSSYSLFMSLLKHLTLKYVKCFKQGHN